MAETSTIRYRAFLSYSHRDKAWAKWLHAALEGCRVDKDLVGRATPVGPVPKTLRPIFRDREDFSAGHSLTAQTLAALEASQFLVVLCSPNAAKSQYVNEEIRRFKALGRAEHIIPVIVDGEPGNPERECFPPALRFKLAADGTLTGKREEPIAADARPQGDGKEIAKQKIVAGLLGVDLDEIVRRADRARKRRNRFWAGLAGVFLLLSVVASGSAVYAWQQLKTNEAFLDATLKTATEIVNTAVAQTEKYNLPRSVTLALLAKAEGLFDNMARLGQPTQELRYRKAWMLTAFANNYKVLGQTDKQSEYATEAYRLMQGLAAEGFDSVGFKIDLSTAFDEVGNVLVKQGKPDEALLSYRESLKIRVSLGRADHSLTTAERMQLLHGFMFSYNKIAMVLVGQGKLDEALAIYRGSLDIAEQFATDFVGFEGQNDLSMLHGGMGQVFRSQRKFDEALASFGASLDIMERLAASDRSNTLWQYNLSNTYQNIGDVLREQGKLPEALASLRASLDIMERLAASDRSNTLWQAELSNTYQNIGDLLREQGDLPEALSRYRASLDIAERLAASDPSNTLRQINLSLTYQNIGIILRKQGKLPEALASYRASLDIAERLAASEPSNVQWQNAMVISLMGLASVSNQTEAQAIRARVLAILELLEREHVLTTANEGILSILRATLAPLEKH